MKPLRSTAPLSSILNPARPYVPAAHTDVSETWARFKKAQMAQQRQQARKQRGFADLAELTMLAIVFVSALAVLLITADRFPPKQECPVVREAPRAVAEEYRFQVAREEQAEAHRRIQK